MNFIQPHQEFPPIRGLLISLLILLRMSETNVIRRNCSNFFTICGILGVISVFSSLKQYIQRSIQFNDDSAFYHKSLKLTIHKYHQCIFPNSYVFVILSLVEFCICIILHSQYPRFCSIKKKKQNQDAFVYFILGTTKMRTK